MEIAVKENQIRDITDNFTNCFYSSTLMTLNNYQSGYFKMDGLQYFIVKYKNKVRIYDQPTNYMSWVNSKTNHIIEIDI